MKNRLLIIVDMLNGFCKKGALASPQFMSTIVPNLRILIKNELNSKTRIIYLADSHEKDDEEFKIFPPHCIKGSEESEIIDELKIDKMEIIYKNRYSGFFNTKLDKIIEGYSPLETEVIIAGNCTDICIHYTAEEFRNRNYTVIIPADCVDTFNLPESKCIELGMPLSLVHLSDEINDFFLNHHFPNILGIKIKKRGESIWI